MTVLVTGAFGFVGRYLLQALRDKLPVDTTIVACGQGRPAVELDNVECVSVDILSEAAVSAVFEIHKPSHVFHLAARSSVQQAHGEMAQTFRTNVSGTLMIARAMIKYTPGATMVFASTGEVYGKAFMSGAELTEDAPVFPSNPYARSKLAAEIALQDVLSPICPVIALRPLNHIGPGQDERFVTASFAAQIARIEAGLVPPVIKVGNLSAERDFLDVNDVVEAYVQTLDMGVAPTDFRLFNIASGVPRSISSVLEELRNLSTVSFDVEEDPERMRPSDIARAVCDASAFAAETGWAPQRSWESTMFDILESWRLICAKKN